MLVFAALTPHPVMAVPDIGKEHLPKLRGTMKAFRELSENLYAAKVDTIIAITPHAFRVAHALTINQRPELLAAFTAYGNLSDSLKLYNDVGFGYSIKESVETKIPISLIENQELDYGLTIPLFHVLRGYSADALRIVPIGTSPDLTLSQHYDLGVAINRKINTTTKRIGVIASGDLSHGASKHAPGGVLPGASAFNKAIHDKVFAGDLRSIMTMETDETKRLSECALRSIALLCGIIDERSYSVNVLSFESPLGVGYLTAQLNFA